jgi:hypothetical protein
MLSYGLRITREYALLAATLWALPVASSCAQRHTVVIGQEGNRRIGQPALDFELARLEGGQPVRLSAQRGKTILLVFWSLGGHALPLVDQAYKAFQSKGLVIWSINYEDPGAIKEFIKSKGYVQPFRWAGLGAS